MKNLKFTSPLVIIILLFISISCQDKDKEDELKKYRQKDSIEISNIETVKMFYNALDQQDFEALNKIFPKDSKGYMGSSEESFTLEDITPFIKMYYSAFPDYNHIIENIFASDGFVVAQVKYTGTHLNSFMEIDSTGNKIEYKGIFIFKVNNGIIDELWGVEDDMTLFSQLKK